MSAKKNDKFTRGWIIEKSRQIVPQYAAGVLTIRGLFYQLVAIGMTNSQNHYKRVIAAMKVARTEGLIEFEAFSDNEREVLGITKAEETIVEDEIENAKRQMKAWMSNYKKNKWENQTYYIEVWIEKKALQGVFSSVCAQEDVALFACKGYPSLTALNDASKRFEEATERGQEPCILYFGDYDPSGEDIPRSLQDNLSGVFGVYVDVERVALMKSQVVAWGLPPAPAKKSDSRSKKWNKQGGLGQVELDAVNPNKLQRMCKDAIKAKFNDSLYSDLLDQEEEEKKQYQEELKEYAKSL